MSLDLDARQRAMLQEMGVTVWAAPQALPAPAPAPAPAAPQRPAARAEAPEPAATSAASPVRRTAPAPEARTAPVATGVSAGGLLLGTPQALYPLADPAATPPELGAAWLIVLESPTPDQPLAGDVGRLLDNMLRAMRLHRHPRAFVTTLTRPAVGLPAEGVEPAAGLQQALAALRPAMVLLLGLAPARALLGSREPLGRLRAGAHRLADGTPAVVSYDPAYLLRAPEAKAAAWADLCHALTLARQAASG
ncbi:MAG: hypothetical protein JSR23_12735 [Proteobacteria bacterium]|nr:hypothetical protein [Pseudomonadota bacterium]